MPKSVYLNYPSLEHPQKGGDLPYKFIVPLDETLKLNPKMEIALHNVEIERPLIVLNSTEKHEFIININGTDNPLNVYNEYRAIPPVGYEYLDWILTPDEVNGFENELNQRITFQSNPFYNRIMPNIKVSIPAGIYSKNQFLETLQDQANKAITEYFYKILPQFYNPYKFAVVNDGAKVFLGLFNESKLLPVKISDATIEMSAAIINSVGLVDTTVSDIILANFISTPSNLAYPAQQYLENDYSARTYRLNTDKTISLSAVAGNNWNTFAFMNSSVNILNNKQDLLTDRQNSGIQFSLGLAEGENEEYFVGFLSQAYQQTHWTTKNQPQTTIIEQINSDVPLAYCGTYFKKDSTTGNLYLHVVGTSNPYYAVDTFTDNTQDPPVVGRRLCYRNSVSPIEEMNVLFSTVLPEDISVKSKSMFGIEFYYRYSTNSKNLIYRNYYTDITNPEDIVVPVPSGYQPENFRLYFRVYSTSSIDAKTNNRILFDSRSIDYHFSHHMAIDNYNIVNPTSTNSAVFLNGAFENVRDAAWNTGIANGMVPFIACKNVAVATGGFFNMNMNSTRLDDYENAMPINIAEFTEYGYYKADPITQIQITPKYNYLPLGIFSYGFSNVSNQLSTILGASPLALFDSKPVAFESQKPKFSFGGFNANRFPFDINAELGISQIYTEGNKYHIIIKNIPLNALANCKDKINEKSLARRQNIIYTLRQSDINLTNVEANNLTITHYPNLLKYLSLYNNNELQLNSLEVEIRNAETGEYATEITDCSLEILFNQN